MEDLRIDEADAIGGVEEAVALGGGEATEDLELLPALVAPARRLVHPAEGAQPQGDGRVAPRRGDEVRQAVVAPEVLQRERVEEREAADHERLEPPPLLQPDRALLAREPLVRVDQLVERDRLDARITHLAAHHRDGGRALPEAVVGDVGAEHQRERRHVRERLKGIWVLQQPVHVLVRHEDLDQQSESRGHQAGGEDRKSVV